MTSFAGGVTKDKNGSFLPLPTDTLLSAVLGSLSLATSCESCGDFSATTVAAAAAVAVAAESCH